MKTNQNFTVPCRCYIITIHQVMGAWRGEGVPTIVYNTQMAHRRTLDTLNVLICAFDSSLKKLYHPTPRMKDQSDESSDLQTRHPYSHCDEDIKTSASPHTYETDNSIQV